MIDSIQPTFRFCRFRSSWSLAGVFCLLFVSTPVIQAQSVTPAAPAMSPQPKEIQPGALVSVHSVSVLVPGSDPDDLFAAQNLTQSLTQSGILLSSAAGNADLTVNLLRADSSQARRLLSASHLAFDAPMHDEGYVLVSQKNSTAGETVDIIGQTAAGIFYGAQTIKQLVESSPNGPQIWSATIRDWPAMKYRGQHDDLSRGPFPTLAFQKHQLEVFAAHKVNLYSPYFESNLEYSADPLAAPPGGALTRDEAKELVAFATPLHIMIVPEQEAFGHVHHVLEYEKYADVAETPHGNVIAPGQPNSLPLIVSWFTQIAADFPSPFLHIGADETFDLGLGRTKPEVDKRGLGPAYADFLSSIHTVLAPLHRRLIFWGDIGDSDPSAILGIPKDMIAVPWVYGHKDSYDNDILPFKKQGLETWVAPGDSNWRQVYPVEKTALDNISGFIAAGQRLGSTGELTTIWNDDGEGLYNQDWFGTLFGAAAGWQSVKAEAAPYEASFGPSFYGDKTGRINQAMAEIIAAEDLIDVSDEAFWLDPWSPAGLAKADKLRPNLSAARLHSERAIELIETALATDPSLREKDSLRAMELGARRIDFIGLKFQLSDEMRDLYAQAYDLQHDRKKDSTTENLLYNISSMNGRCQDLRDGFSLLKNLYRESWMAENRPYWIDNVLVRYDLQTQLWQKRGQDIDTLIDNFYVTRTLPPANQIGIPAPVSPPK
ncbi:glycoside hydrolase family 20 zincin-like fold domain-containing protein [Granulicella sp. L46]|uniref:glycoside hydrolase family 20 zincin-like fold domain-containing protein n=1 Tax=Granulicella sp. L46 TaxID=1641865 RepID=UPI00131B98BC|nr:glycoside hydrolase family 20 zincin-like fold domain-containing protein [Granulicella sp. L46]